MGNAIDYAPGRYAVSHNYLDNSSSGLVVLVVRQLFWIVSVIRFEAK